LIADDFVEKAVSTRGGLFRWGRKEIVLLFFEKNLFQKKGDFFGGIKKAFTFVPLLEQTPR
jgi:hypothetical protein